MVSQRPIDGRYTAGLRWYCGCGCTFETLGGLDRHKFIGACPLDGSAAPSWKRWLLGLQFDFTRRTA